MRNIIKGFTLIELLVVITIIGILATGATSVYTSQIQKARDTTRINDVKALQSGIEQVYQDDSEYPKSTTFATDLVTYVEKLPKDPKHAQPCNNGNVTANATDCGYAYVVGSDNNGILLGTYEVSTAFENEGNVTKKAALDGGGATSELSRLELGLNIDTNTTGIAVGGITVENSGACGITGVIATTNTQLIVIKGNPATALNECG